MKGVSIRRNCVATSVWGIKNYLVLSTESMMLNFIKSLQWLINIFNSVDKTKLSYIYPSLYIYIYIYMKVICKRRSGIVNYALISRELEIRVEALAMSLSCALGRGTFFSVPLFKSTWEPQNC